VTGLPAVQEMSGTNHGYPRPQLFRSGWVSLNGPWDFAMDCDAMIRQPEQVTWNATISVPFSPETEASGIGDTGFYCAVWYRRRFERPSFEAPQRLRLHFGAVDYRATVWVNGLALGTHEGGYAPFSVDITDALRTKEQLELEGPDEIIVRAEDDPADLAKPRGKQDWKLNPHSIWYPRTTGIWQTVWMEVVPPMFVESIYWTSSLERWEIGMQVRVGGIVPEGASLAVRMEAGDQLLANDIYSLVAGEVNRRIALSDPGIDDYRNTLLWSPSSPTVVDVQLELRDQTGQTIDCVQSYTALRSIATQGDRFILNGRPLALRMVLDQGYWPESGLTAPNDDAFLRDVLLAKALGFNGVRKHQKIEDPRFLYWADHLGLLVWEEMPSAYRYTASSVERLTNQWIEILKRDRSHPCIVTWVPFNESWGVPDLPDSSAQRNYVQALYHLTKTIDPTRLVIGNDGWESVATDIIGIHDYDDKPERMAKRYGMDDVAQLLTSERPGGRMLLLGEATTTRPPIVLTEFGGIAISDSEKKTWGYSTSQTAAQFLERYSALMAVVRELPALAGFCYTQFTDTYQEANGLLQADRTPKAPLEEFALATSGKRPEQDAAADLEWRKRIMDLQRRQTFG
jgi:hypothetical protein